MKQNETHFVKISVKGLKMTLVCRIWTVWTMSTTVTSVGHLLHFLIPEIWSPNVEFFFYEVHCSCQNLSCIAAMSEDLVLWQSMPRLFYRMLRSKSSSWIHIGVKRISQACCLHNLKNMEKKIVKHNFRMKNKIERIYLLDKNKIRKSYIKWRKYIQITKLIKNYNPNNNQILVKNIHSFVPICMGSEWEGGSNCQFGGKNPQVNLIIGREWPRNTKITSPPSPHFRKSSW